MGWKPGVLDHSKKDQREYLVMKLFNKSNNLKVSLNQSTRSRKIMYQIEYYHIYIISPQINIGDYINGASSIFFWLYY